MRTCSRSRSRTTSRSRPRGSATSGRTARRCSHEGGLHRVVAGREVRVDLRPRRRADRAGERRRSPPRSARCSALPFDLDAFRAWAVGTSRCSARSSERSPGFRPTLNPHPFEALVVADHHAADLAPRRGRDPRALRRALRRPARRRLGVPDARAHRAPRPRRLHARSASRGRRPSTCSSSRARDLDLDALAALDRRRGRSPSSRAAAGSAAGPPTGSSRATSRGRDAWPAGDLGVRKAVSTFYAAGRPLSIEEVRTHG